MRVAWFSPMYTDDLVSLKKSPHDVDLFDCSRSCYASSLLLPELAQHLELELFHNGGECVFERGGIRLPVFNYLNAAARAQSRPFDCFVYQVEDSPVSGFCRHHLGLKPGVVWFHNILLRTRGPDPLSHSPWEHVIRGVQNRNFQLPDDDVWPETNEHYPRREASLALASVFSQAWDRGEWKRRYTRSVVEPLRERLGLAPMSAPSGHIALPLAQHLTSGDSLACEPDEKDGARIGFMGEVGAESRYHKVFAAVRDLKVEIIWYTARDSLRLAQEVAKRYSPQPITVRALESPRQFAESLRGLRALVATQFSLFGNHSPWVEIACAGGVPTLVSDFGAAAYYAGPNLFRLPVGRDELGALGSALRTVLSEPVKRSFSEESSPGEVAREWVSFLTLYRSYLLEMQNAWGEVEAESERWVNRQLECNGR